ncbi:uncharacterized protein BDFB_007655 [Asbolus verrucosus]|uniref:Uncharacterized protein n=1 Tax=Asbolus verrucosus TaxID=1661398 RepID=A0A482W3N8_ASBVE|nr:uncharacterized protein BDFB_007655 [Asbolus verrucosus]
MGSPSQKVVIPKGLVNPNETTIVEIPIRLKHLDMVIARPKQDWSYGTNRSPFDNFNPHDAATFYHEGGMFHPDHPANRTPPSLYDQSPVSSMYTPGSAEDSSSIPVCSGSSSCPGNSSSGAYQRFDSSGLSPGSPDRSLTQSDVMNSLGQLESSELHKIMGDLSDFQSARRKLVFDASSLASAADVSSNILSHTI